MNFIKYLNFSPKFLFYGLFAIFVSCEGNLAIKHTEDTQDNNKNNAISQYPNITLALTSDSTGQNCKSFMRVNFKPPWSKEMTNVLGAEFEIFIFENHQEFRLIIDTGTLKKNRILYDTVVVLKTFEYNLAQLFDFGTTLKTWNYPIEINDPFMVYIEMICGTSQIAIVQRPILDDHLKSFTPESEFIHIFLLESMVMKLNQISKKYFNINLYKIFALD